MERPITAVFACAFAVVVGIAVLALGPAITTGQPIALPSFADLNGATILKWLGIALLIGIPTGLVISMLRD